jgi:hypothetical protein
LALLGAWAVLLDQGDLSDTAWPKRFVNASRWLDWLLGQLLAVDADPATADCAAPPHAPKPPGERVILIDSTMTVHPSGKGEDWRTHLGYNLSVAHFDTMLLTDDHTAEDSAH